MKKLVPLIEQFTPEESRLVTESVESDAKSMYLKGVVMQAESYNRNKRKYPLSEIVNAVKTINEQIQEVGGSAGELGHPTDRIQVMEENISHMITECHMDGNVAIAKIKILPTPKGMIAKALYESGLRPATSSRGQGEILENQIISSYCISCVDLVLTPSVSIATPKIVYESKQYEQLTDLAKALQYDKSAQKYFNTEINKFIKDFFN